MTVQDSGAAAGPGASGQPGGTHPGAAAALQSGSGQTPDVVVAEIRLMISRYNRYATLLQSATVVLTVVAVTASIMVGVFATTMPEAPLRILAATSAVCTALLSSLRASKKAADMRNAYRRLNSAWLLYNGGTDPGLRALIEEYRAAEELVGQVEVDGSQQGSTT